MIVSSFRGMNLFAALSIASVTSLESFVRMNLEDKYNHFGALVGSCRMVSMRAWRLPTSSDLLAGNFPLSIQEAYGKPERVCI